MLIMRSARPKRDERIVNIDARLAFSIRKATRLYCLSKVGIVSPAVAMLCELQLLGAAAFGIQLSRNVSKYCQG